MIDVLKLIKKEMDTLKLNYAFDDWNSDVKLPYWVGEIAESPNPYEDGKTEYTFMLTGTDVNTYSTLFDVVESIKEHYTNGFKTDGMIITYENMICVPVDDIKIKRVQINLNIRKWEIK